MCDRNPRLRLQRHKKAHAELNVLNFRFEEEIAVIMELGICFHMSLSPSSWITDDVFREFLYTYLFAWLYKHTKISRF